MKHLNKICLFVILIASGCAPGDRASRTIRGNSGAVVDSYASVVRIDRSAASAADDSSAKDCDASDMEQVRKYFPGANLPDCRK